MDPALPPSYCVDPLLKNHGLTFSFRNKSVGSAPNGLVSSDFFSREASTLFPFPFPSLFFHPFHCLFRQSQTNPHLFFWVIWAKVHSIFFSSSLLLFLLLLLVFAVLAILLVLALALFAGGFVAALLEVLSLFLLVVVVLDLSVLGFPAAFFPVFVVEDEVVTCVRDGLDAVGLGWGCFPFEFDFGSGFGSGFAFFWLLVWIWLQVLLWIWIEIWRQR